MNYFLNYLESIRCCSNFNKNQLPQSLMHSSCLPIIISRSDPFYAPHNVKCMGFVRSNTISNNPYQVEVGEQANGVTSYLDLSPVYGSDYDRVRKVRSFNGGRLKVDVKNILPLENGNYFSGDVRATQTSFLAIFHSLFTRSHNGIAEKLGSLNQHWGEEKLFQEARKINIAVYQKFVYDEWLSLFLGSESLERIKNAEYDINVDGSTLNDFSNGAFRIFHAFIPTKFHIREGIDLSFSDILGKTELLNYYEDILNGMMNQKMSLIGYSSEVLNQLFKNHNKIGLDLLSMDMMRGRDHGIPSYYKYRKFCNVLPHNLKVFNDLAPIISNKSIVQLRQTYKTVYDIDLIVGGALENVDDKNQSSDDLGYFGPTLQCIIAEQFYRLKAGDFYFYSHNSSFTEEQLSVIKTYSFADFLCENSNTIEVKKESFLFSEDNVKCQHSQRINLSLWQEYLESEDED